LSGRRVSSQSRLESFRAWQASGAAFASVLVFGHRLSFRHHITPSKCSLSLGFLRRRPSALSCLLFRPASRAASRQAESRRLDSRCPHVADCARFLRLPSILIRGPVPWFNRLPPVLSGSSWFWLRFVNRAQQSACPLASVFCAANPGIPLGIRSHRPLAQQAIASRARASISLPLFSLSPVLLKRCRSLVGSFRFCSVFPPLA
jgi:hypothetical protein